MRAVKTGRLGFEQPWPTHRKLIKKSCGHDVDYRCCCRKHESEDYHERDLVAVFAEEKYSDIYGSDE